MEMQDSGAKTSQKNQPTEQEQSANNGTMELDWIALTEVISFEVSPIHAYNFDSSFLFPLNLIIIIDWPTVDLLMIMDMFVFFNYWLSIQ